MAGLVCTALGCGQTTEPDSTGSASFAAHVGQALSGQIESVSVALTAENVPTRILRLTLANGVWSGTMHNIPVGTNRTFTAEAYDAQGALRFRGSASGVTITEGQTAVVAIMLQDLNPPPPFDNTVPCITALVASSSTAPTGGVISLRASAHDPDVGDTLTYDWTATSGSFSSSSSAATTWTAPATEGTVVLTLTVTDSRGASARVSLSITVQSTGGAGQGSVVVNVSFNLSPSVQRVTSSLSPVPVGQSTTLTATASDADGDPLTYAWSASCQGTWANQNTSTPSFTPSAVPAGDPCGNCALTVTVTDSKGGRNTGTLRICVGDGPSAQVPPRILHVYQSAESATCASRVTLRVIAEDGNGGALSFAWSTTAGTLGTPSNGFTSSEVVWTAPSSVPSGAAPAITATVSTARGSTTHRFSVAVLSAPSCTGGGSGTAAWSLTESMNTPRQQHKAILLASGKVLVVGGHDGSRWLDTAELYDPETGTWAPAGRTQEVRESGHVLTLLPSGKVLVTGGRRSHQDIRSAELYDPATNIWSAATPMTFTRNNHTATVLPSGKVLVIGGNEDATAGKIPELYDPATNTWLPFVPTASTRSGHHTLLLSSGRVLTLGSYRSAELYNPITETWTTVTGLGNGGWNAAWLTAPDKVLLLGGQFISMYDLTQGTMTTGDTLIHSRSYHTVTMLDSGRLVVIGGNQSISPITELYDPATRTTSMTLSMPAGRYHHTATLLPSGKVLVAGGLLSSTGTTLTQALLFTPPAP